MLVIGWRAQRDRLPIDAAPVQLNINVARDLFGRPPLGGDDQPQPRHVRLHRAVARLDPCSEWRAFAVAPRFAR
ncbi:MAG TPA: hypothetical protein VFW98_04850 [Gemmatimonadaceae bacterium]|nr:hypothetical protein [Gemmatimonadaceae bacterium]